MAEKQPQKPKEEQYTFQFSHRPPEEVKDADEKVVGYLVRTSLTVSKGKKVKSEDINFFANNQKTPDSPLPTDDEGNLNYVFKSIPLGGPDGDGFVSLSARLVGTSIGKTINDVPVPKKDNKPLPLEPESILVGNAENGIVLCSGFEGTLEIVVQFGESKKSRETDLKISAGHKVSFSDDETEAVILENSKTCAIKTSKEGKFSLRINFLVCGEDEVGIKIFTPNSSKSTSVKLKYKMF